jgi:hypothetical protein
MPGKTLQDAIMEQLNTPEHQALHDAAERFQQIAEDTQTKDEKQSDEGQPGR